MAKRTKRRDSKGRVLEKGEGQRRDGRYYFAWLDDAGKRHFVYGATLEEVRSKKASVTLDILTGVSVDGSSLTLNDAIKMWRQIRLEDVAIGALKQTTLNQYQSAYDNHVRSSLGNLKIKEITRGKLEAFYKCKMAEGLGISQITNMAKPINQALFIAEESGWIKRSPTKGALKIVTAADRRKRCAKPVEVKALTEAEQTLLLEWLRERPDRLPLRCIAETLLYTGMRIGELAALQQEDVSSEFIAVKHSFAYFSEESNGARRMIRVMQEPKSTAGNRVIPLLQPAARAISEFQGWKEENGITLIEPIDGFENYVFLTREGWPQTSSAVNYALKRAVDAINREQEEKNEPLKLPHISCHWLRRTFATRLCEAGVSPRVAQYVLGHADFNLTMGTYTAAQAEFTASEMLKIMQKGVSTTLTPVQQIYNKIV